MVKYTIAFDCDGVLRSYRSDTKVIPIERIRTLAITLTTFKNCEVVAWSKRGADYAKSIIHEIGLDQYIKKTYIKGDITPDIAIDDQHEFDLGVINLIVNEREHTTANKVIETDDEFWTTKTG